MPSRWRSEPIPICIERKAISTDQPPGFPEDGRISEAGSVRIGVALIACIFLNLVRRTLGGGPNGRLMGRPIAGRRKSLPLQDETGVTFAIAVKSSGWGSSSGRASRKRTCVGRGHAVSAGPFAARLAECTAIDAGRFFEIKGCRSRLCSGRHSQVDHAGTRIVVAGGLQCDPAGWERIHGR